MKVENRSARHSLFGLQGILPKERFLHCSEKTKISKTPRGVTDDRNNPQNQTIKKQNQLHTKHTLTKNQKTHKTTKQNMALRRNNKHTTPQNSPRTNNNRSRTNSNRTSIGPQISIGNQTSIKKEENERQTNKPTRQKKIIGVIG